MTKFKPIRVKLHGVTLALDARSAGFNSPNPDQICRCSSEVERLFEAQKVEIAKLSDGTKYAPLTKRSKVVACKAILHRFESDTVLQN